MSFEIIRNSESNSGWDIEDKVYEGPKVGFVAGFNFEVKNKDNNLDYMSAIYIYETPDEYINELFYDYFDTVKCNGYEPTGRVIFRGYAKEYYDPKEKEWLIEISA